MNVRINGRSGRYHGAPGTTFVCTQNRAAEHIQICPTTHPTLRTDICVLDWSWIGKPSRKMCATRPETACRGRHAPEAPCSPHPKHKPCLNATPHPSSTAPLRAIAPFNITALLAIAKRANHCPTPTLSDGHSPQQAYGKDVAWESEALLCNTWPTLHEIGLVADLRKRR